MIFFSNVFWNKLYCNSMMRLCCLVCSQPLNVDASGVYKKLDTCRGVPGYLIEESCGSFRDIILHNVRQTTPIIRKEQLLLLSTRRRLSIKCKLHASRSIHTLIQHNHGRQPLYYIYTHTCNSSSL